MISQLLRYLPYEYCDDDSTIFGASPGVMGVAGSLPSQQVLACPEGRTLNTKNLYMKQNLPPGFLAGDQVQHMPAHLPTDIIIK